MEYKAEELIPIVAELAQEYAGVDSTSVTYETAQMLIEAVKYCLDENEKSSGNDLADPGTSVKERYVVGSKIILEKAEDVRMTFNSMSAYFDAYRVECLEDTVMKGIPEFMKWYDVKYCPQNTLLTLDYPLLIDIHELSGIDAIHAYIKAIEIEQIFLKQFDRNHVISVLSLANPGYVHMIDNICEIILINTVGHAATGKPLGAAGFTEAEYENLAAIFADRTVDDLISCVESIIRRMIGQTFEDRPDILEYLISDANNIAVRIDIAVKTSKLDKIFVV